jgi:hypothetical protein
MAGFVKVFESLLESTVWMGQPAHVKLAWITLLAKADPEGRVTTPIPVLATLAGVTLQDFENALEVFLRPDPYSRSREHDGRRLERLDDGEEFGGFLILNYLKYRELRSREIRRQQNREAQERFRRKQRSAKVSTGQPSKASSAQAEAEAEAEITPPTPSQGAESVRMTPAAERPEYRAHERLFHTTVASWSGWTTEQHRRLLAAKRDPERDAANFRAYWTAEGKRLADWTAKAELRVQQLEAQGGNGGAPTVDQEAIRRHNRRHIEALKGHLGPDAERIAIEHAEDSEEFHRAYTEWQGRKT